MKRTEALLAALCLLTVCLAGCGEAKKTEEQTATTAEAAVTTATEEDPGDATTTDETEVPSSDEPAVTDAPATPGSQPTAASKTKITRAEKTKVAVTADSVMLNKNKETLLVGESTVLTATVSPQKAADAALTWTSSNPAVAAVDATGKVTAKAIGAATVTVKAGTKSATCDIQVDTYALDLPSFPASASYRNPEVSGYFEQQVKRINAVFSDNALHLTFHGKLSYSSANFTPSFIRIGWQLQDSEGTLVRSGIAQTVAETYVVGDSYDDAFVTVSGLAPGRYRLKIVAANGN